MGTGHVISVAHTGITVSDLDRSLAFFRDVLGQRVTERVHCQGEMFEKVTGVHGCEIDIAYVHLPNHTLELLCYSRPSDKLSSTLRPCDNGHLHLSFNVDDIDAVIASMRQAGFAPVAVVQTVPDGELAGARVIYTQGPDNLTIELMQLRASAIE